MVKSKKYYVNSENSKNSFWQALLLTLAVFAIGIFLGMAYEGSKLNKINEYYVLSEILLMDSFVLNKATSLKIDSPFNCGNLIDSNINFANRIYSEALELEIYEESGKLTDELKSAHRKYDLLRTLLWINFKDIPEECKNETSLVIYLYEYETKDLKKKATNVVWSRILLDLKQKVGNRIVLIPIAVDSNLSSLDFLLLEFEISNYPTLIIDDDITLTELRSVEEIIALLR